MARKPPPHDRDVPASAWTRFRRWLIGAPRDPCSTGTDPVQDLEHLCIAVSRTFKDVTFFAGKLVFARERWYHRWLHNETAFAVQKRLQAAGLTLVILPRLVR